MSGRIDDVDSVFIELTVHTAPKTSGRSGRNGDTALLLLLHPIHGGSTIVNLTNLVRNPGVKKNAFSSSGFTGINVGTNSDIAIAVNRGFASHVNTSSLWIPRLESEVRERLIGFSHAVHVFTLLDCISFALRCVHDLAGKSHPHRLLSAVTCVIHQPAH